MNVRESLAFRFAVATLCCTFVLLLVGGVVSATGSGLACPDWPQCYGTFFPRMVGPVFFEHGHRIFAFVVGNLTIINLALVWWSRRAGHPARSLAAAALGLVIWQGVLGGMTVRLKLPESVTTAHLATSMVFFSVLIWGAFRLRPRTEDWPLAPRLRKALAATAGLVYLQLVLGAVVRHTKSGLVCTGWPLCSASAVVNAPLGAAADDPQILIHMAHRGMAVLVAVAVTAVSVAVLRAATANRLARTLALIAPGLVVVQIFLGMMSVMTALDVITVTAHLGTGALLLANMVSLYFAAAAVSSEAPVGVPVTRPVRSDPEALGAT